VRVEETEQECRGRKKIKFNTDGSITGKEVMIG